MNALTQFLLLAALDVAGLVALWFLLRARIRRYLELDSLLSGVREEARSLVMELNETADRNVSLVEDRISSLRVLLDELDRRMGIARRELDSREAEKEVYSRLARRRPILPSSEREEPLRVRPRAQERQEGPLPARPAEREAEDARAIQAEPIPLVLSMKPGIPLEETQGHAAIERSGEAYRGGERDRARRLPEVAVSEEPLQALPNPREEALRLHRQGFSVDVIAARVGATLAEIELLVELDERRSGA